MKKIILLITLLGLLPLAGHAQPDMRTPIVLNPEHRAMVLAEMRDFLKTVQQINLALAQEDFKQAAMWARKVGRSAQAAVPTELKRALPAGFKKLGGQTHAAFDQLAMDMETMEDVSVSLNQLGQLMNKCISCHAAYQIKQK